MSIASIRTDYHGAPLDETEAARDPFEQFRAWIEAALMSKTPEPTAMVVATADEQGRPSARVMLLKGFDERGFTFFTNYESRKGAHLAVNPHAAMTFFWPELHRQVRIEGSVERVAREESIEYFSSRPRDSQLGAWASHQSAAIPGRHTLAARMEVMSKRFPEGTPVPTPEHWGGYRLSPTMIEFWQGRPSRLHDRLRYTRLADGSWRIDRLAP
ncbi:MAG: pyridoxamine 5'-phosphate oxidase [Phycisphaeraceae bacterium]|nr:pyridoxamine 5'-phosphate oxidase [Phycisphaerales bacterium]QOJ18944.1 MAG: pyridoxamine 5'-phosphate oxidase [Phycisphaeraceae bacterium]